MYFYLKLSFWCSGNNNHSLSSIWALSWGNLTHTHTHTHIMDIHKETPLTKNECCPALIQIAYPSSPDGA